MINLVIPFLGGWPIGHMVAHGLGHGPGPRFCPHFFHSFIVTSFLSRDKSVVVMGAATSRFKRKHHSLRKSVHREEEAAAPKIVLFTGYSHKMNLAFALPFAEDPLSKFKVLVTMPSLSSSEYLADSRVLNLLNKTLFVLQMDIESDESINGVLREIMENDGFIDAVGKLSCMDVKLCNMQV